MFAHDPKMVSQQYLRKSYAYGLIFQFDGYLRYTDAVYSCLSRACDNIGA